MGDWRRMGLKRLSEANPHSIAAALVAEGWPEADVQVCLAALQSLLTAVVLGGGGLAPSVEQLLDDRRLQLRMRDATVTDRARAPQSVYDAARPTLRRVVRTLRAQRRGKVTPVKRCAVCDTILLGTSGLKTCSWNCRYILFRRRRSG